MKRRDWLGSKSGVTLVELLVVMLIVVILAVTLTPLFRDYIVRAQYTAEAVPVVGDMRVKIELYRYDNSILPGVLRDENGATRNDSELTEAGGASLAQTFMATDVTINGEQKVVFRSAVRPITSGNPPEWGTSVLAEDNSGFHFASDLNLDYENLTGSRLRPNHVFYYAARADGGYEDPSDQTSTEEPGYMYAVGVFGEGRLRAGSGYAVLEINNPVTETKVVATWERFRQRGPNVGQVVFASAEHTGNAEDARDANVCWIGDETLLLSTSPQDVADGLADLRTAGWKF